MIDEVKELFQSYIDDWTKGYQILVDSQYPSDDDNADKPILLSDTAYITVFIKAQIAMINEWESYGGEGCVVKADVRLSNNTLSITVGDFVGVSSTWVDSLNMREQILDNKNHYRWNLLHEGDLYAVISDKGIDFKLYYENAYHNNDIRLYWNIPKELNMGYQYDIINPSMRIGDEGIVSYNVDSDDVCTWNPNRDITPTNSNNILYGIKGYPFICNSNDITYINDFVTNNNATNNYSTTYTTPENKTITVYYGDNYIITHVDDDEQVSYNDIKNALDIAVNKINDDNDTDIKVPSYIENKYGDNLDKNHEIDMPVSKYSTASGMVYYYQLEPDDVWKVRDGLNTINLDPLVLKDVTRNLISYKLFALDKTALMDEHTPVIVHIGGREIKYNDASIPAEYIKTVKNINLGAITINRIYHDYRDYAPYVKIELFVPFCGWTSLPSWCMDTTITGTMFIDLMNGSCKAVIKANSTVVCEIGGVCAYDVPFVADATGSKASSLLAKVATTAGAVASGNPLAIATTGISLATAMNDNYTRMMGVCGDGSNINGLDRMYVKITRVSWTNPLQIERPDIYKHTYGIPCGKSLTLTAGDGYTQIMDANITGAMTDREKQMIVDGFRHGLIL